MAASTKEAHEQVVAARKQLGTELDQFRSSARSAVDIPAKIKRNPIQTVGLIGGAGFLAVGGPKRVLKSVMRRVRPEPKDKLKGILPKDVEHVIARSGAKNQDDVRATMERDFAAYLHKKKPTQPAPNARQSFWKTYDTLIGPLGAIGATKLAARLFAPEPAGTSKGEPVTKPLSPPAADSKRTKETKPKT